MSFALREVLRRYREEQARELAARQLLARFAPEERASPDEAKALLARWRA